MKILNWNVCGLGKLRAVRRLKNKLRDVCPQLLFLIETKLSKVRMESAIRKCGFQCGFDVAAVGSRGGLSLGWSSDVNVSIRSFSQFHIDADITEVSSSSTWRFTGFYGNPVESLRHHSWDLLRQLGIDQSLPWVVMGDFNEILLASEKKGGLVHSERNMEAFRSALSDCDLSDLDAAIEHLPHAFSDHAPVMLNTLVYPSNAGRGNFAHFRFDANWTLEEDCGVLIRDFWSSNREILPRKLSQLGDKLKQWSRAHNLKSRKYKDSLKSRLHDLMLEDPDDDKLAELLDVKLELNLEADKEELFWEQRARVNWLQHGDRNTSFFHKWASFKKKKRIIRGLNDADGQWVTGDSDLNTLADSFFKDLFTSVVPNDGSNVLNLVQPTISTEINNSLLANFSQDEVYTALQSMAPMKASGLDGYPALFYKKYWSIVGEEVSNYCIMVLTGGADISEINNTNIILVPKVDQPTSLSEFRPISLCNVVYKLISKILANRLRNTLHYTIDDSQGAFVPGRQFSDNVLIAYELLHALKNKKRLSLVVSIWAIWSYRNNKLHNNTLQSEAELIRFIRVYIAELTSHGVSHTPSVAKTDVKWTPPPGNTIKFNFDASFDSLLQSSVSRVVARNSDGFLMAAGTTPHHYVANPEWQRHLHNIYAMKASFVDLKFAHVNRFGNSPAHLLAKEGKNFSAPMVWIEEDVPTVEVAVQNDRWWVQRSD
ncbi:hypothetical protein GQ457_04G030920 [Hibiscus cannabinus]